MEEALGVLLPRMIGTRAAEVRVIDHRSKDRLLRELPRRLAGYAKRLAHEDIRVLVAVDRDNEDCRVLKARLEGIAEAAGLPTKSAPDARGCFRVVNRIVIEELEAWFFGDIPALRTAYPGIPASLARRTGLTDPDAIMGGTWERLLRELQRSGHYRTLSRLPKMEVARKVAAAMTREGNTSRSFHHFLDGLEALLT